MGLIKCSGEDMILIISEYLFTKLKQRPFSFASNRQEYEISSQKNLTANNQFDNL
jgi:hypothetical protein